MHTPAPIPLVIASFIFIAIVRALIMGGASASGDDITRRDNPAAYWAIIIVAALATAFLLWKSFQGLR